MSDPPIKRQRSRTRIAVLLLVIVGAVVVIVQLAHQSKLNQRLACGIQIKSLGTAAKIYASDNDGDLAAIVESLVARGELPLEMARCPVSGKPYLFAPISTNGLEAFPPSDVLVYEPLSYHQGEGANMLFGDGHASFISADRYNDLVGHLQAHP